jgi:hypothetical protein
MIQRPRLLFLAASDLNCQSGRSQESHPIKNIMALDLEMDCGFR